MTDGRTATMGNAGRPARRVTGKTVLVWLAGFFGVVFAANIAFVWLAFDSWTGLEVESAYKAGQGYQQEIEAARGQAARGWVMSEEVSRSADGTVQLHIRARDKAGAPLGGLPLTATLKRPTQSADDRVVALIESETGLYSGTAQGMAAGQWDLLVEAADDGALLYRSKNRVFLSE